MKPTRLHRIFSIMKFITRRIRLGTNLLIWTRMLTLCRGSFWHFNKTHDVTKTLEANREYRMSRPGRWVARDWARYAPAQGLEPWGALRLALSLGAHPRTPLLRYPGDISMQRSASRRTVFVFFVHQIMSERHNHFNKLSYCSFGSVAKAWRPLHEDYPLASESTLDRSNHWF